MLINLDEETHIYTNKRGVVVPSVTQIINAAFPYEDKSGNGEYYRDRGRAVHLAIHYIEKGTLDPASVAKDIWPYISGYFKFKKQFKHKILASEERVYHKKYRYCGTLDRRTKGAIWDYKTGIMRYVDAVQLTAYAAARVTSAHSKIYSVYLGKHAYKIHEHKRDKSLFSVFLACLQIYQVKKLHGLL